MADWLSKRKQPTLLEITEKKTAERIGKMLKDLKWSIEENRRNARRSASKLRLFAEFDAIRELAESSALEVEVSSQDVAAALLAEDALAFRQAEDDAMLAGIMGNRLKQLERGLRVLKEYKLIKSDRHLVGVPATPPNDVEFYVKVDAGYIATSAAWRFVGLAKR